MPATGLSIRSSAPWVPFLTISFGSFILNNAWAALLAYHLGLVLILFLERQGPAARNLAKGLNLPVLFAALLPSALSGIGLYFAAPVLGTPSDLGSLLANQGLKGAGWPAFILYYSTVNPALEEWYWRGYLGSRSRSSTISDLCYAGYHPLVLARFAAWPWLILEFVILAGAAWLWRQIARKYDGLLIPLLSHLAADLSLILSIYWLAASP